MASKIERRRFLTQLGLAAAGALAQGCARAPSRRGVPAPTSSPRPRAQAGPTAQPASALLTFLYTGDTHGHLAPFRLLRYPESVGGMARRSTVVSQIRESSSHALLVDAGDVHHGLYQSSLMADAFQGAPDVELMNGLGYVAMGLGDHDVAYGWETFARRRASAFFPILSANLVYAESGEPVLNASTVVVEGGVRVAFTAFVRPALWQVRRSPDAPNLAAVDPIQTAQALVPRLRERADLVVVLGHLTLEESRTLVTSVPGIDIVIAVPDPAGTSQAIQAGGAIIVQVSTWGAHLGRLDVDVLDGRVTAYDHSLIALATDVPADPNVEAQVASLQAELRLLYPRRYERIGEAVADISSAGKERRDAALGNLVCEAVRRAALADVALFPSGQLLNSLFAGPIIVQDLHDALPYTNPIALMRATGEQLQRLLDLSASLSGTGEFMQVSGCRFRIVGGVAADVEIGGRPLDVKRVYDVATTVPQATRLRRHEVLSLASLAVHELGLTVKEALAEHIRANSPISPREDERIVPA